MVLGMLGFNFQLTLPLMAKKVYHVNAAAFGLLGTSLAAGALAGALAGASRRARPSAWLVVGAALTFGVLEMLVGFGPTYLSAALLLVPTGFFMIFYAQASNQRVQLGAEPEMRGRVMSLYILAFLGTNPLAAPVIGWCGQTLGPRSTLWLGGAASLTSATLTLVLLMRRSGGRPRARLKPWPMLHVVLPAVQPAASWQDSRHGRPAPDRVPGG
jgi:predicted MFS family arabinose efflux permease